MKQLGLTLLLLLGLNVGTTLAYNLIGAEQVKEKLTTQAPLRLVDIQVAEEFSKHHLPGAIATSAYPVKSDQDKSKLAAILADLNISDAPVVIVCPRGKGGAKRTYDYLNQMGIAEERLFILENGQDGWPYAELVQTIKP